MFVYIHFFSPCILCNVCQDDPSASSSSKRRRKRQRRRFPSYHHKLEGMRAQGINKAIDYSIALNNWCVTFKDEDGVTVDLVSRCILCVWLHYMSEMVRLLRNFKITSTSFKPTSTSFKNHAYVTFQITSTPSLNHAYVI